MSSKDEIALNLKTVLKNSLHYKIILEVKQMILDELAKNIPKYTLTYNFTTKQTVDNQQIYAICSIIEFGFELDVSDNFIIIDLKRFL